jgi:pimeloyl-ACP methyl ester carboxylesterase
VPPPKARPASLSPPPPHFRRQFIDINIPIPNELWGAASLALKLWAPSPTSTRLSSLARPRIGDANAMAMAMAERAEMSLTEALDYKPRLSMWEETLCVVIATALCACATVAYRISYSSLMLRLSMSPRFVLAALALWAITLAIIRSLALEVHYQALQRSETELAGADSQFYDFDGVKLHLTRSSSVAPTHLSHFIPLVHCLHGFGASIYSYSFVQDKLAKKIGGVVTAHDLPGFGLSSRPSTPRPYSLAFNGAAAEAILDEEASRLDLAEKTKLKVIIGHSMGAAAAAEAIIQRSSKPKSHSERLALVLVAPAIVAMWPGIPAAAAKGDPVTKGMAIFEEIVGPEDSMATKGHSTNGTVAPSLPSIIIGVLQILLLECLHLLLLLMTPILVFFLRNVVRSWSFWYRGLTAAWADKTRVTKEYVDAYRRGQLVCGWEYGILRFLNARLSKRMGLLSSMREAIAGKSHLDQAGRLAEACLKSGTRVLIVHGTEDALIPVENSRRLAGLLPNAEYVEFNRCGHMPQEECPDQFVECVSAFILN